MLKKLNNQDLILLTVGPILGLFLLICLFFIIYKYCFKKQQRDDEIPIFDGDYNDRYNLSLENLRLSSDINLVQKVNQEIRNQIRESRESAYVYLQFFIRSNPDKKFVSIEHLYNIGSQSEVERNWFLVKQAIKRDNTQANKYRIIFINSIDSKSNTKIKKIADIADSMSMNITEMEVFLEKFFRLIKHPNFLPYETLSLNLEKNKILFIQDYSRDGSLRDHLHKNNPNDVWELKSPKKGIHSIGLKSIKEYSKQILNALIYLKQNFLIPFDNLHSGNVILANKKKMCLLTGYENSFFFEKTRADKINDKNFEKLRKIYLIQVNDSDGTNFRKAKSDIEKSRLLEIVRFGFLIVEMCLGNEPDNLLPNESILASIKSLYNAPDFQEIKEIFHFLFFNRTGLDDSEKYKNKFVLPTLEQLIENKFFSISKFNNQNFNEKELDPEQIEFLNYMTGKLEIKIKKLKRKSSVALNQFSNRKQLSCINETSFEITEEKSETDKNKLLNEKSVKNNKTILISDQEKIPFSPPPPPPPAPPISSNLIASGPVPPPPPPSLNIMPNFSSESQSGDSDDRSALLGDIRKGMKLKKTVTIDKSKPMF